jgi:hypothetical protein
MLFRFVPPAALDPELALEPDEGEDAVSAVSDVESHFGISSSGFFAPSSPEALDGSCAGFDPPPHAATAAIATGTSVASTRLYSETAAALRAWTDLLMRLA